jgi:putative membrane protein insertion efficiency factor
MAATAEKSQNVLEAGARAFGAQQGAPLQLPARVGLMALRFYKAYLSVLFAGQCRFVPSCSQYSYEAVERFGLARGSWLTLKRLLRCHPFSGKFGYDPVPDCCGENTQDPQDYGYAVSDEEPAGMSALPIERQAR